MIEKIPTTNPINRRQALAGAGAAVGAMALAGPVLAKAPSQAMSLWHEWMAAFLAHGPAIDGPNFEEADMRWDRAGEDILNLSDGTPEAALVKLAVAIDWIDNCTDPSEHRPVYSAYNELSSITGLDPLAELNRVRASQA